jgi:hypothetical protein
MQALGACAWRTEYQTPTDGQTPHMNARRRHPMAVTLNLMGAAAHQQHAAEWHACTQNLAYPRIARSMYAQGEIFAAEGWAKVTGKVGVCIATSGPGATNLVTGLADAMMDSVPLVAITGQVRAAAIVWLMMAGQRSYSYGVSAAVKVLSPDQLYKAQNRGFMSSLSHPCYIQNRPDWLRHSHG